MSVGPSNAFVSVGLRNVYLGPGYTFVSVGLGNVSLWVLEVRVYGA